MLNEVKSYIPHNEKIKIIDATFGGGGYSISILKEFNVEKLIAIDRDPLTKVLGENISKKYKNFTLKNGCFSKLEDLILSDKHNKKNEFDAIIFDLGLSSNQLDNPRRGFSFMTNGPLDMGMGLNQKKASEIINTYSENDLANIIYNFGEEKLSRRIASKIVSSRKIKFIETTKELSDLIKSVFPLKYIKKIKINPATKTFQALRVYLNDELNEISIALNKSMDLLKKNGSDDFKFPYQGTGKNPVTKEYYSLNISHKNTLPETMYIPHSIENINTRILIRQLFHRLIKIFKK